MEAATVLETMQRVQQKRNELKAEAKDVGNDIKSKNIAIESAAINADDDFPYRDTRMEIINHQSYKKQLQSEGKKLKDIFEDLLDGKGDYDASQLSMLDSSEEE